MNLELYSLRVKIIKSEEKYPIKSVITGFIEERISFIIITFTYDGFMGTNVGSSHKITKLVQDMGQLDRVSLLATTIMFPLHSRHRSRGCPMIWFIIIVIKGYSYCDQCEGFFPPKMFEVDRIRMYVILIGLYFQCHFFQILLVDLANLYLTHL